jgi:NADH-quinone oxidoreductase subunit G
VGALTSTAYRFRARPWDIENAGTVCTLCPSQCNVEFSVRDDTKVLRVFDARHNEGVDDGWLCDKGRFGYQTINSGDRVLKPLVREGGVLHERSWENALERVVDGLKKAGSKTALIAGGETTNEEGFLGQKLLREVLGSGDIDSRTGALDADQARILARPELTAAVPDIEWAGAVLVLETELVDEMPIIELRVRKGRRRNGVQVAVASSHPSALDRDAAAAVRFAPGSGEALLAALAEALGAGGSETEPDSERSDGAGEVVTEPDPGAPAPVAGPGGQPGAMAGGPPGEQSDEGAEPTVTPPGDAGEPRVGAGESGAETGSTDDPGAESGSEQAAEGARSKSLTDRGQTLKR